MRKIAILTFMCCFVLQIFAQKKGVSITGTSNISPQAGVEEIKLPDYEKGGGIPLMEALQRRETSRNFSPEDLPLQELSNILWAANGINRPENGKRTAPSARNAQEIDIYVFMHNGVFLYNPEKHMLSIVVKDDLRRKISEQKFYEEVPVVLVYVANYDKMGDFSKESRDFYSAADVGFISQNVYLYCASSKLATVVCGAINRELVQKVLDVKNGKVLFAQPVGYHQ